MRAYLSALLLLASVACARSRLTAFRDPSAPAAGYVRVAVFALGMELANEVEVERQLCARLTPTPCVPGKSVVPPIRMYSKEEVTELLGRAGVDGVLLVTLVADRSQSTYLGTTTSTTGQASTAATGNANLYGNAAYWSGTAQTTIATQSTSTDQYVTTRAAVADVGLYNRVTGLVSWRGELKVSSHGVLATDGAFIRSATARITKELRTQRLVR